MKTCYKFELGQIVEMVHGEKEINFYKKILRRFISNECDITELANMNAPKDGDLYKVHERRIANKNNVELNTQEFTLFGRSGLRNMKTRCF